MSTAPWIPSPHNRMPRQQVITHDAHARLMALSSRRVPVFHPTTTSTTPLRLTTPDYPRNTVYVLLSSMATTTGGSPAPVAGQRFSRSRLQWRNGPREKTSIFLRSTQKSQQTSWPAGFSSVPSVYTAVLKPKLACVEVAVLNGEHTACWPHA